MLKEKSYSLDNINPAGSYHYASGRYIYLPTVLQALLSANGTKKMQDIDVDGMLTKSLEDLLKFVESHGGKCVISTSNSVFTYLWEDSFIDIHVNEKSKTINVHGLTLDPKLLVMAQELERDYISKIKKNLVFTIIKQGDSLTITNMGDGSSPLIVDNYLPEVLEDVDAVIKSFNKNPPNGRICILNGEPGTGKTHLIRSILMQLDAVFLIVPSNMISSLDKPEIMPLLLNVKNEHEKPIILIIEDGDTCLVPRKNDNISTIASLLNLSDGILGTIIDVKMIISTNADIGEMDQAILRPGRLCRNIHVGALPYEQANRVYQRLMKDESINLDHKRFYTLAEIYDHVNNIDTIPTTTHGSKRVIGFSPSVKTNNNHIMNKGKIGF